MSERILEPVSILGIVFRRPWATIGLPAIIMAVFIGIGLARPERWRVAAAFTPERTADPTRGARGLAAQLGLVVSAEEAAESPEFYLELLRTERVRDAVVTGSFGGTGDGPGDGRSLVELWNAPGRTEAERRAWTIERLDRRTAAHVAYRTNIVRLFVEAETPDLAAEIAAHFLEAVDRFNREARTNQARHEREFLASRLATVAAERTAAEVRYVRFLERNRTFRTDPALRMAGDRLEREVARLERLQTELGSDHERARAEEVRSTPVISILEHPRPPARPRSRRLLLFAFAGFAVGAILGWSWAVWRETLREAATQGRSDWIVLRDALSRLRSGSSARS